ncbi:MAG: PHB depolymerase family esterase [Minwuia sp.]|nr:PHB depolymerase family esterase [Minwuia sp.]
MKVFGFLLVCLCFVSGHAHVAHSDEIAHDGRTRSFIVDVPQGLQASAPTVFVLHGGGGTAERIRRTTALHQVGARQGFVTVYPQGAANQWNDARNSPVVVAKQGGGGADDVGFLRALVAHLVSTGVTDPGRVHVVGLSNGGMMAFRLACEAADVFAAFVPVIASLPEPAEHDCRPARAVPMMVMNGTVDRLVPWDGGPVAAMFPGDRGRTLSTARTMAVFSALNGCSSEILDSVGGPGRDPVVTLNVHRHLGCRDDVDLRLYAFVGMGHRWPGGGPLPAAYEDLLGPAPRAFPVGAEIWSFLADKHL